MAKKKKETMEYRVYEVPRGHSVLTLFGDAWVRVYGDEQRTLHFHNLMEIGICRYGAGELVTPDGVRRYQDGMITIFPANYPHTTVSDGMEANFWEYLFFDPKTIVTELFSESPVYINEVVRALNDGPVYQELEENPKLTQVINSIIEEAADKRRFHHQVMDTYMKILIFEMMRLKGNQMPYYAEGPAKTNNSVQISAAINYIQEHLDSPIKAADLAAQCNMSETHFRRIFEEYADMSPMDYVNFVRIQKACELMRKGNDSMELVAEQCGFASVSTFNRNFKKYLDTSPYQWKIAPENYEGALNKYHISPRQGW